MPGDEVHSKRPMRSKEEHQPPHRYKGALPARLARARSARLARARALANSTARACVTAPCPPIPAPLAARSPTRNARRGRPPLSVGESPTCRARWTLRGASRPAGQNGGQPRSGYLAVARAGSLGPTRSSWRVSQTDTAEVRRSTTRLDLGHMRPSWPVVRWRRASTAAEEGVGERCSRGARRRRRASSAAAEARATASAAAHAGARRPAVQARRTSTICLVLPWRRERGERERESGSKEQLLRTA